MNEAQQIFTLFYAIYFGLSVSLTRDLEPFDTVAMTRWSGQAWLRFGVSFIWLNIVQILYFGLVYWWLGCFDEIPTSWLMTVQLALGVVFLSLAGFGFYRMYWGIMLVRVGGHWLFYGPSLTPGVRDRLRNRSDFAFLEWWRHFIMGFILFLVFVGLGWLLVSYGGTRSVFPSGVGPFR